VRKVPADLIHAATVVPYGLLRVPSERVMKSWQVGHSYIIVRKYINAYLCLYVILYSNSTRSYRTKVAHFR
jgi:hypothetical protein